MKALVSKWNHNQDDIFDNRVLRVNWHLGNTCTYKCSYCDPSLNSGDIPWPSVDRAKIIIDDIIYVFNSIYTIILLFAI